MLGPALLAIPRRGALNMHGSLLPKFRGRAPVNWAVLKGESQTGATLHAMTERADRGPILDQEAVPIGPDDTAIEGARWGASLFWTNPVGSMVLTQFGTADQARAALGQYRAGIHDTGICTESTVSGRADAFLCTPKDLGEGVNPGDLPAIGLGLKGTIVALVTVSDPVTVQQLLGRQLDRLP